MNWIKLCAIKDLALGESRLFEISGQKVALFHINVGFYALDDHCPHRSGPLSQGFLQEGAVSCPWHQWIFDLKDGRCRNIPGQKVRTFPVREREGGVEIEI